MTAGLRALVVDDEPLARRRLRRLIERHPSLELVGECGDGEAAVAAIGELRPELVFLDVQMPELDGFGVVARLGATQRPQIVFVTAFDRYALDAFEVAAIDYLLKPFDDARFERTVERVLDQAEHQDLAAVREKIDRLLAARGEASSTAQPPRRFAVRSQDRVSFVALDRVDWFEAAGDYVRLHAADGQSHLVRESLGRLERELDRSLFVRIHRSAIVRLERIETLEPLFHGDLQVTLHGGRRLRASRTHAPALKRALGIAPGTAEGG